MSCNALIFKIVPKINNLKTQDKLKPNYITLKLKLMLMKSFIKKSLNWKYPVLMKGFLLVMLLTGVSYYSMAQININGKVIDQDGEPLVGVSVIIKGTSQGTVSDLEGNYSIEANQGDILQFSFLGYLGKEVTIEEGITRINITLEQDLLGLEEVVVIGYGTQRKSDVTSAITSVRSDEFVQGAVKDAGQLLQGKVAGLAITNASGNPLDGPEVRLRGITSLKSEQSPLVLVDGVPGSLDMVAPQDIESIDVLKDGSAAAIYGTRGTNGVIIVTTRKGSKNKSISAEYSSYISTQRIYKRAPFYGAEDYRRLAEAGIDNFSDMGSETDWLKEITHNPFSQMHNFTIQGGSERTSFIANINYNKTDGFFNKSYLENLKSRIDITHEIWKDKLSVNMGAYTSRNTNPTGVDMNWVYRQAMIHNPTEPLKNEDGSWYEVDKFQYENPVALIEEATGENKGLSSRYFGNITFTPVNDLKFNLLLSKQLYNSTNGESNTFKHISNTRDNQGATAFRESYSSVENLMELTTEYSKVFGDHRINAVAGYSYQYYTNEKFNMRNKYFPTDVYTYNNMGAGTALVDGSAEMFSEKSMSILVGFFGRLNYSLAGKYLLSASIRHEGSSKFGENYKWGNFPAIQAGWKISEESFMKSIGLINNLKIRVGYGVTGIVPDDPYKSLTLLNYSSFMYVNGSWVPTIVPGSNPNPDLRWERKTETNLGLDFGILQNRISGTIDIYKRLSSDLLYDYPVPAPPYLYTSILANAASIEDKGIEVLLSFIPVQNSNLTWVSSINFSKSKNKLVSLEGYGFELDYDYIDGGYTGDPIQQGTHRVYVGEELGNFWGYKSVDISDRGRWLIETPEGDTVRITSAQPEDKQVLGNGFPKVYLGWNNTINIKNFDISLGLRGAFGAQILNFQRMFYENPTISYNMLESSHDLVYGKDTLDNPQAYVSYYIENGDYLKIDNLTVGYTFKPEKDNYVKSVRVYLSALNLYTFTGYKGLDPEVSTNDIFAPGNDNRDKYPTMRTFTAGLQVKF